MCRKSTLLLITAIASFLGFIYFGWLAFQAAWLGSTPNFPADVAREAAMRVGGLAAICLLIASLSLFWFFRKSGAQPDRK